MSMIKQPIDYRIKDSLIRLRLGHVAILAVSFLYHVLFPAPISACAMSAIISTQRNTLDEFPAIGNQIEYTQYNDPWDYIGFVMANSNYYTNSDGYGIVAYSENEPELSPNRMWFKRIYTRDDFGNVYYTGNYLDTGDSSSSLHNDILDIAMNKIKSGVNEPSIVMCHARSASGATYGNHPFIFQYGDRTFSFMHNGNVNNARSFMIHNIDENNHDDNWFVRHPSNYFGDTNPQRWVDSEVMFHYIMNYIISYQGDVLYGLQRALDGLRTYIENTGSGVFNFVMSDGSHLYVYRSSPLTGSYSNYKLSYRTIPGQFYGIRTQAPYPGDIELKPRELVVFSREQKPSHYPEFYRNQLDLRTSPQWISVTSQKPLSNDLTLRITPNPFSSSTSMRFDVPLGMTLKATIYNLKGEVVWHTQEESKIQEQTTITWDGKDDLGRYVTSGIYVIKTEVGYDRQTGRIIYIK